LPVRRCPENSPVSLLAGLYFFCFPYCAFGLLHPLRQEFLVDFCSGARCAIQVSIFSFYRQEQRFD
jgi:hypothetical protein